jgi:chemotaxis protein MotB
VTDEEKLAPIIIIKKKVHRGGHHGGAWKVAYADFVTAMMALFIVLWLLSSSEKIKKAVGSYFSDPTGTGKLMGTEMAGVGDSLSLAKDDMQQLKQKLQQAMKEMPKFEEIKDQVRIAVTGEGLRVELLETDKGMFFQSGNAQPSENGKEILLSLAKEMGKLPNEILIEGHTDSKPFNNRANYSNWELSADRANAARRIMEADGLRPGQVKQVRGFADQNLRKPEDPENASNRRVSVIVKFLRGSAPKEEESAPEKPAPGHAGKSESHGKSDKPEKSEPHGH